jgi:predicted nucleic acid-binding protein
MITFVDTNILLDVFLPDPVYGERSSAALERAFHEGSLIVNEIVYAELAPQFHSQRLLNDVLGKLSYPRQSRGLIICEPPKEASS